MNTEVLPVVEAASWALLHFVWQGAALALLLALMETALERRSASVRYAVCCAVMLMMLAAPVVTFALLYPGPGSTAPAAGRPAAVPASNGSARAAAPFLLRSGGEQRDPWGAPIPAVRGHLLRSAPWLVSLWLAGVTVLALRMLGGWLYARSLGSRMTAPLPEAWQRRVSEMCRATRVLRPVRILTSALVQVPAVTGWLRPILLVPASALAGLAPDQLEAVIAHELAHIRRHDYVVNLLQTAAEVLLFYHPAVWWVSRETRREREHCCDDVAVEVCGSRLVYARALAEIERLREFSPRLAQAADGASLPARIHRILGAAPQRDQGAAWIPGALALTAVLAAGSQFFTYARQPASSSEPVALESFSAGGGPALPVAARSAVSTSASGAVESPARPPARQSGAPAAKGEAVRPAVAEAVAAQAQAQPPDGGSFIEQMARLGYQGLSVDDFITLKSFGVTPQLVRELKSYGYEALPVRQLARVASHGVTEQYLRELKGVGLDKLPIESLVRLRSHGVTPAFVHELTGLGYKDLSAEQVVSLVSHGVDPRFIRDLQAAGYRSIPVEEIVRARSHGVDGDLIKELRGLGYAELPLNEIIRMRDHGVDGAYVRALEAVGLGRLKADEIVRARDHGLEADFVKQIRAAGYPDATLGQLVRLRDRGVAAGYIETIRKAGYDRLSLDELMRMRDHGIDGAFIQRARSHGFQNLTFQQLIRLKNAGVLE